jgi:DNA-binding beta-propeller fold protein YncE
VLDDLLPHLEITRVNPALVVIVLTLFAVPVLAAADSKSTVSAYEIKNRISAPAAVWDYAAVDARARRLYIGRVGGVMAVDLDSLQVTPVLVASRLVHAVLPLGESGLVASTNGMANSVSLFEGKTGTLIATIPAEQHPDALILEPKSGLLVAANRESDDLTLIDVDKRASVGSIVLGGKPEFLTADGQGLVYNNISDRNEIAVVDIAAREVVRRITLSQCHGPTGLAFDERDALLISVCENGVVKFINAKTYTDAATFRGGKGSDAVIFDSARSLAFIPSADDGMLTVFAVRSVSDITVQQKLPTKVGTRTGALDATTGTLYLPTAEVRPPEKPGAWPSAVPGTFIVLVIGLK